MIVVSRIAGSRPRRAALLSRRATIGQAGSSAPTLKQCDRRGCQLESLLSVRAQRGPTALCALCSVGLTCGRTLFRFPTSVLNLAQMAQQSAAPLAQSVRLTARNHSAAGCYPDRRCSHRILGRHRARLARRPRSSRHCYRRRSTCRGLHCRTTHRRRSVVGSHSQAVEQAELFALRVGHDLVRFERRRHRPQVGLDDVHGDDDAVQ